MTTKDVSHLTGEDQFKRPPKNIQLNEVRFNGKEGKFFYYDVIGRKEGEKTQKTELGSSVQVIFLNIRRRISGFKKGDKSMKELDKMYSSTEHNTKNDVVYLFGAREKGRAEDLYNKFKDIMHTERVIYAFLLREGIEKELVRVIVKGSTLNPKRENKAPGVVDFFTFMNDKPKGAHSYDCVTILSSAKESGPLGEYFLIDFKRGAKLDQKKLDVVIAEIETLAEYVKEQDAYYKEADKIEDTTPVIDAEDDKVPYPSEEINPDDIPF